MDWFSSEKRRKKTRASNFLFLFFWEIEKYDIIRKMHAFQVFPKTEYLTRRVAVFLFLYELDEGADENQDCFSQPNLLKSLSTELHYRLQM